MNRLIIIGNGFDLAHGVKSKYEDFLLWYLKSKLVSLSSSNPSIDRLCTIKIKEEEERYNYGRLVPPSFDEIIDFQSFIEKLKETAFYLKIHSNFFNKILGERRWIDIENIYYSCLKVSVRNGSKTVLHDTVLEYISSLNADLDFLRDKFLEYLKAECNDLKYDLSQSPYLKLFNEDLNFKTNTNSDTLLEVNINGDSKALLLNFNYTNLIKKYEETTALPGTSFDVIQIHGSIDSPGSIVFGFGDELDETYHEIERLNENKFFEHIKSFRYFQDGNYQKLMAFVDSSDFEVLVLGHSLGLSDRTMLSQIFENDNLKKVQLYYHKDQKDFTEKTYEISRHFKSKGRMREIIVPFTESKRMPQVKMNTGEG